MGYRIMKLRNQSYKGTRKYKGTRHALNAFMRNTALFGTMSSTFILSSTFNKVE